jgi:Fe2+ transport system protein FeoA
MSGIAIHVATLGEHMLLSEAREGQSVVIERIGGHGALRRRLQEMGILKGTEVTIEKYAPLKDPMELVVKGYHVSLRIEEAAQINVLDIT